MAKKPEYTQGDMFPVIPEIAGLGITKFEISGAAVKATVEGATNTNDIALLDSPCWQKAVSAWLLNLCGGDVDLAMVEIKKAYIDHINQQGETHRPTPEEFNAQVDEAVRRGKDEKVVAEIGTGIAPLHGNKKNGNGTALQS